MGKEKLKALGREALRTGSNIIREIAENPPIQTTDNLKTCGCLDTEYNR